MSDIFHCDYQSASKMMKRAHEHLSQAECHMRYVQSSTGNFWNSDLTEEQKLFLSRSLDEMFNKCTAIQIMAMDHTNDLNVFKIMGYKRKFLTNNNIEPRGINK